MAVGSRSPPITQDHPHYDILKYSEMARLNYAVHHDWTWAQRCYTPTFWIDPSADEPADQCILQSCNTLCTICISPLHSLNNHLAANPLLTVTKFTYSEVAKANIADRPKQGKSRKARSETQKRRKLATNQAPASGLFKFDATTVIATATTSDHAQFIFHAGVDGDLVDLNLDLETNPSWVTTNPFTLGHLAVFYPSALHFDQVPGYLTVDQYRLLRPLFTDSMYPDLVGPRCSGG